MARKPKKKDNELDILESTDTGEETTSESKSSDVQESPLKKGNKYDYIIKDKRVRGKVARRRAVTFIAIALALLMILGGTFWGVTSFLEYNNFKIMIDREGENVLSLSPNIDLRNKTEVLYIDGPPKMDNISISTETVQDHILALEEQEGSAKIKNMVAATFYLTNVSSQERVYMENLHIVESTRGVVNTIRILIIRTTFENNEPKTRDVKCYATPLAIDEKTKNPIPKPVVIYDKNKDEIQRNFDGHRILKQEPTNEPWMTIPFSDGNKVIDSSPLDEPIPPGGKVRYTLAIWIEGWDPSTTNDVLGGQIKIDFKFSDSKI